MVKNYKQIMINIVECFTYMPPHSTKEWRNFTKNHKMQKYKIKS